ncbi:MULTISPECIES: divalent metal cation transporter [unclassified Rhodanobacter]|uniref:NRAMP family divalent metal transporter n=1 Tax=unclassified Rhodanobacter TaxID=2621553 RepID=UPI0020C23D28|nr:MULTISPECIES: divalent metal cation transporter [unclassified Rhodanobacter]
MITDVSAQNFPLEEVPYMSATAVEALIRPKSRWTRFAVVAGPGIVVMLADTDAGSIITAAQSGAESGYRLLLLQAVMIPILFVVQELTIRLGIFTGQGHGHAIRQHFGPIWAWISVSTLLLACLGALITELSGIAGVGALIGIPNWLSMTIVIIGLTSMAYSGSYLSVERIALAVGLFECVFLYVAWQAKPDITAALTEALKMPLTNSRYLYLIAANIGAVIMPWMVFYQQSAVAEKGLVAADLPAARWDTAIGSVVTQLIMAAVLVAVAATIGRVDPGHSLDTVQKIVQAITPFLGERTGTLLFALGMIGAALVATIVVTLTAARTLGEIMGYKHSLAQRPQEARWFYGVYTVTLVLGGLLVTSGVDLVKLSVGVQVMNALLLPIVLGFLYTLARRALPEPYRLKGAYAVVVGIMMAMTAGLGLYAGIIGTLT